MFHRHKWSDWSITEKGQVIDGYMPHWNHLLGSYIIQSRYCHVCGKTQIDLQKTTMKENVVLVPEKKAISVKHDPVT